MTGELGDESLGAAPFLLEFAEAEVGELKAAPRRVKHVSWRMSVGRGLARMCFHLEGLRPLSSRPLWKPFTKAFMSLWEPQVVPSSR